MPHQYAVPRLSEIAILNSCHFVMLFNAVLKQELSPSGLFALCVSFSFYFVHNIKKHPLPFLLSFYSLVILVQRWKKLSHVSFVHITHFNNLKCVICTILHCHPVFLKLVRLFVLCHPFLAFVSVIIHPSVSG